MPGYHTSLQTAEQQRLQSKLKSSLAQKVAASLRVVSCPQEPRPAPLLPLQCWASAGQDQQAQSSCCRTSGSMEISQPSVCPKADPEKGHPSSGGAWTAAVQLIKGTWINRRCISDKDLKSQSSIKGSLNTFPCSWQMAELHLEDGWRPIISYIHYIWKNNTLWECLFLSTT